MEYLQCCFVRMEDFSVKKFLVQLLIYRFQIVLSCFQDPIRHGLSAQMDALAVDFLFLTV